MWLKKPFLGLTKYLLRLLKSKLRMLVELITGNCPLNKHLHNIDLIDEPICIAYEMEDESACHLLCNCPSLSVEEYEGASTSALLRFALASGRFTVIA
jgi:hypothetical protein